MIPPQPIICSRRGGKAGRLAFFALPALLLLLAGMVAGDAADAPKSATRPTLDSLFEDTIIAQGKGVKVTSSELERAFVAYRATASARGQRISEDARLRHEAQLLDRMIITQLLTNRATRADLTNAEVLAEKFVTDARKAAGSDEALTRQLKATGTRFEHFQQRAMEEAIADAVLERELKSTLTVSDADVNEFYKTGTDLLVRTMQADLDRLAADPASKPAQIAALRERIDAVRKANLERLEQPEKVRIAHVFVATRDRKANEEFSAEQKRIKRQLLERLRARALAGEDFMKLVQEFSEDPNLPETKGEYTLTQSAPFSAEFKAAAFSLEPGKLSDVVVTSYGLHLIKLLEKTPAKKADFDTVSKELKDFLHAQAVQKALPAYFAKVKKEGAVEILDARYRAEVTEGDARRPAP